MAATVALTLAACASSDRSDTSSSGAANTSSGGAAASDSGSSGSDAAASSGGESSAAASSGDSSAPAESSAPPSNFDPNATFVFGAASAPEMFDPLYATDGESFRPARQMMEGLVSFKDGTTEVEPALAESWESSTDGKTWTFKIRKGVKFHDGTDLNPEAVCFNLERMYNQTGAGAVQAQYWADNMGGFKDQKDDDGKPIPSLYQGCTAEGDNAVIKIANYTSKFPALLGLSSFSIQSPTALEKYDANNVQSAGEAFTFPAYAMEHPTGTGPMKFGSYDKTNGVIELDRFDDYWGAKANVAKIQFKIIPDETARKQALQAGTIQGYDLPNPADWDSLSADYNLLIRPAFNVMYLGINVKNNEKLKDLKVRQAIAYALNREELVASQLPEGATVALNNYPDTVEGWTDETMPYPYDPEKAKTLLAEAGASDLTVNFWWPTEVSRPYMPDPKAVFTAFSADLEAVGIKVNVTSKPWNGGYLDGVNANQPDLFLLGWTGDYPTPDNFIAGSLGLTNPNNNFDTFSQPWGQQLADELKAADAEPDATKRDAMYVELNKKMASEYLPDIPISHSPPALVLAKNISGIVQSPLGDEDYSRAMIAPQ